MLLQKISDYFRHEFHVISNVRPIVWIMLYIIVIPIFAVVYWALPDGQFRIPDNAGTDFGSWLYYSIVTITTLGFGDYTPAHGWAQGVTAIEVMCGLLLLGFFLNAVGSLKSEIDVTSEIEKQRKLHEAQQTDKLKKMLPSLTHSLSLFISSAYTYEDLKKNHAGENPDEIKTTERHLIKSAYNLALALDFLQTRVDITLWPQLLEDCFAFVAHFQVFSADNVVKDADFRLFLSENLPIVSRIEEDLNKK